MSGEILLEGLLEKKGEKGVIKTFKKRRFVLYKTGQLRYYDEDKEMGFILMDTVKEVKPVLQDTGTDFEIVIPSRTYLLRAPDHASMNYWVDGLNKFNKKSASEKVKGSAAKAVKGTKKAASAAAVVVVATTMDAATKAERIAKYGAPLSDEEVEEEEKRRAKAKKLKEKENARHDKEKAKIEEAKIREKEKQKRAKEEIKKKTAK